MSIRRISVLAALLAVGALNVAAFAQTGGDKPKTDRLTPTTPGGQGMVGKPAPDFTGTDLDGKTHKSADLKGKIVVLEWFSSKCPVCAHHVKEKKTMQNTLAKFKGKDVIWLGIDSNVANGEVAKPDEIKAFVKESGVTYPVMLDPDGKIARAFSAKTTPHMFVIDKTGIIAYEGAIDSDPSMKEPNATNYVEAAVQALVDGSQVATKYSKPYGCSVKIAMPGGETKEKEGAGKP